MLILYVINVNAGSWWEGGREKIYPSTAKIFFLSKMKHEVNVQKKAKGEHTHTKTWNLKTK